MMNGKIDVSQVAEEENLFYKINHRLVRLYEVMQESKNKVSFRRISITKAVTQSRKSRPKAMLQNTKDISLVRIYRTENMTTDKSKMVVASIMQTLFKESFFEIIFALLQSTYSPYRKRF